MTTGYVPSPGVRLGDAVGDIADGLANGARDGLGAPVASCEVRALSKLGVGSAFVGPAGGSGRAGRSRLVAALLAVVPRAAGAGRRSGRVGVLGNTAAEESVPFPVAWAFLVGTAG